MSSEGDLALLRWPLVTAFSARVCLDLVPKGSVNDRIVPARIGFPLVRDQSGVGRVGEHHIEIAPRERLAARHPALLRMADLGNDPARIAGPLQQPDGTLLQIKFEDRPNGLGFALVHGELAVPNIVAKRRRTPRPHALLPGGRDLVPDALGRDLALELGE